MQGCHYGPVNWTALARAVTARRVELGHDTQKAFAKASQISLRTINDLELGERASYSGSTLARLERALGWPAGRVDEILAAGAAPLPPVSAAEIARQLARDDFVLTALIAQSGLSAVATFRLNLRIRALREQQAVALVLKVADWLREAGGHVPDPVWPPLWLQELIDQQDAAES